MTNTSTLEQRLLVRFNDESYRPAKIARINYENKDYFSIEWAASDDVKIDVKLSDSEANRQFLDPNKWNIEVRDKDHFVKISIDSAIWIIDKWTRSTKEVSTKYGRSMRNFLDVKIDYGKPYSS